MGSSPEVIEQTCIDALTRQAREVNYRSAASNSNSRDSNPCSEIEKELRDNAPEACADLTGAGDDLGRFTVVPLGGLAPILSPQNSSSDCWPGLPKSDNLLRFGEDTTMNDYTIEAHLDEVYKTTPILTIFTPGTGTSNPSLVVTTPNLENAKGADKGAAALLTVNNFGVVVAAAVGAVMLSLL
ncbi:hypothetical protein BJY01DRAFT_248265 [Aspergillus pseudoustus]|uniref:Uncharacterized protein n=1 Tax=Aspergillus pseudoustus TaxID=1810923 RepID=A0ABR4JVS4_9EURO